MEDETRDNTLKIALEAWKTTIELEQHFNNIGMQIRNLAITVLTAVIGAAGIVYLQVQEAATKAATTQTQASTNELGKSAVDMIIMGGIIAWIAFYLMDRWWYHRLLHGTVKHAYFIERELAKEYPGAAFMALSTTIGKASPFKLFGILPIHTDQKIDLFYGLVLVLLVIIIWIL